MTEKTGKSSDKLRALSDPPIAMSSDRKIVVDPQEMLRIWSKQSEVLREVADGQEESSREMRQTRTDNAATRNTARKTRGAVLLSCTVTVLSSLYAAHWVTSVVTKVDKDLRVMVSEQTENMKGVSEEAQKTREFGEEVRRDARALAELQSAVLEASIAQQVVSAASPVKVEAAQKVADEKIASASAAAKNAKRIIGPVSIAVEEKEKIE